MYYAMNRITVNEGRGPDLEAAFANRANLVKDAPGFLLFQLLRPTSGNTYVSLTSWKTKEDFDTWTKSESFGAGHKGSTSGVAAGRPTLEEYEVCVE
jgi:heme-degrading monooxygenase HmoA